MSDSAGQSEAPAADERDELPEKRVQKLDQDPRKRGAGYKNDQLPRWQSRDSRLPIGSPEMVAVEQGRKSRQRHGSRQLERMPSP